MSGAKTAPAAKPPIKRSKKWVAGVPDYLYAAGIRARDWQFITVDQLQGLVRPAPGHTLKTQLWGVGMLHGPRFSGEAAIVWYKNDYNNPKEPWKSRYMTPGDMGAFLINESVHYFQTALDLSEEDVNALRKQYRNREYSRGSIRRALAQLELDGLCERRRKKDGKPLREMTPNQCRMLPAGEVVTYFFHKPRNADPANVRAEYAELIKAAPVPSPKPSDDGNDDLSLPKIPLILKSLQIDVYGIFAECSPDVSQKQASAMLAAAFAKPEHQVVLRIAYDNAREVFTTKIREVIGAEVGAANGTPSGEPVSGVPDAADVGATRLRDVGTTRLRDVGIKTPQGFSSNTGLEGSISAGGVSVGVAVTTPPPSLSGRQVESSSNLLSKKDGGGETQKPKPEYASARDEVKAIYYAKAGSQPDVRLMDQIEAILAGKGKTWDQYIELLRPEIGMTWKKPGGFLTHLARVGFDAAVEEPKLKPAPKCPRCRSDKQEGAVFEGGAIVACPDCSTPEWRAKLSAKLASPPKTQAAGG